MDEDRRNWPIVAGVVAGVLAGLITGFYVYSSRTQGQPDSKLHDAADIIAQCRERIKEIETGLESLKAHADAQESSEKVELG